MICDRQRSPARVLSKEEPVHGQIYRKAKRSTDGCGRRTGSSICGRYALMSEARKNSTKKATSTLYNRRSRASPQHTCSEDEGKGKKRNTKS